MQYERRLLDRAMRWYVIHDDRREPIAGVVGRFRARMDQVGADLSEYLRGVDLERVHVLSGQGP